VNPESRLKIAVFIDFDNIEIGVKSTLGGQFDIGTVLEALKERGEVVSKTAYSDWKRAGEHSRSLSYHAIKMVQRNLTPGGDKNGADINLALDALEMAFTHPHINAYVIVGGDSDFISLVEKLKQYDKKVIVVGGRSFTSNTLQKNCHEFIAYENLIGANGRRAQDRGRPTAREAQGPLEQAFPLVRRALKVLADREVSPQLGLLKSTLLQLDSTFSERSYGASTFRDFAERLEKAGLVTLKVSGRNIHVELKEDGREPAAEEPDTAADESPAVTSAAPDARPIGDPAKQAEGVAAVRRLISGSTTLRFPMYVRNVRQVLRAADGSFDERRFGFGGLMDLLRACQREGVLRLERDRRGALRVFPGAALQPATPIPVVAPEHFESGEMPLVEPEPAETAAALPPQFADEAEEADLRNIKDATAEMLAAAADTGGTRRRRKTPGAAAPSRSRRATPRSPRAPSTRSRGRKPSPGSSD
jgi:uncharacterized LabA/DUF88 family protein